MRGTYTHYNTDFTNDIFHMADLGFTELSMEPVVCDPSDPSALTEADLPILKEQYEILAKEMIKRNREGRGFTFYHYMIDLTGGPCIYKRISGCGSGTEYMAVTPWGDLYPCHQFVGDPQVPDGRYLEGCHQHGSPGRVQALQRLRPQGVPGLLGKALLLRRLCSQLLPRNRQHHRRVRVRL